MPSKLHASSLSFMVNESVKAGYGWETAQKEIRIVQYFMNDPSLIFQFFWATLAPKRPGYKR